MWESNAMPIPQELLGLKQFVNWRMETRGGEDKPTKIPYNPLTGKPASSTNPETWVTFNEAQQACKNGQYSGIGFMFSFPYVGIDFDYCIDEQGNIDPPIKEVIDWMDSYTEVSPSGKGIHLIVKGKIDGKGFNRHVDGRKIEIYQEGRYFTLTGNCLNNIYKPIEDRTDHVKWFYNSLLERTAKKPENQKPSPSRELLLLEDEEIIEKITNAQNGAKFSRLYNGDKSDYDNDDSRADEALCFMLAFYTKDPAQIDRLFRSSGLYRQKWERADYRERTISHAIDYVTETYNPNHNSGKIIWGGVEYKKGDNPAASQPGDDIWTINRTDVGNAKRLVKNFGNDIRYCHDLKKWLIWNGSYWEEDKTSVINSLAQETVRRILYEAAEAETKEECAAFKSWHGKSEAKTKIDAMIDLGSRQPDVAILSKELNTNPYLLNVKNGTINLRTGELYKPNREDFITKRCPVEYDPTAKPYVFEEFLQTIFSGNSAIIEFIRRAVGYSLTASITEQALFVCYGIGANGKSTLLKLISRILDGYAASIPAESLMAKKYGQQNSYDIARLPGTRFVTSVEVDEGNRLSESLVKQLTGGDRVSARQIYNASFEFDPTFKIWMGINHKPIITGTDNGIWRRVHLIPFEVTIPKEQQDDKLHDKLFAEASGVLNWAISGCLDWLKNGLQVPDEVRIATDAYRQDMDKLAGFIDERCSIGEKFTVNSSELYSAYKQWCDQENIRPIDSKKFKAQLTEKGFNWQHTRTGKVYNGITLLHVSEF